jgi:AcrR family transcriptional regulator
MVLTRVPETRPELSSHDRILEAARTLFSADGYENTTTSAIARVAGTSESQLIKHFGSKEGLLEAIFDQAWSRLGPALERAVAQAGSPTAQLRALSERMIRAMEGDPEMGALLFLEGRRIRRHGHIVLLTGGFLQLVDLIDRVLQAMRDAGELRPGLHLQAVRSALVGCLEGMLRDQLLALRAGFPALFDGAEMRAAHEAVLASFLAH